MSASAATVNSAGVGTSPRSILRTVSSASPAAAALIAGDLAGFAALIDALGGLELCLPGRLVDPEFDGSLENEVVTARGKVVANCRLALQE